VEPRYDKFCHRDWRDLFSQKLSGKGLEIGALHRPLPTHGGMQMDYADRLSLEDLREHYPELRELNVVRPNIISDAESLTGVEDDVYDFLVSAHLIEHMRDPIGAIKNWARVVKPGGYIYLIVPDKRGSFDRYRSRTPLEHMILDYMEPSKERDFSHYVDYSVLVHSKHGDEALKDAKKLAREDYSIHFHVFMPSDILAIVEWMSENVVKLEVGEGPCASPGSDEFHLLVRVG
jgi:SAM-dependent methyltransferase